MENELKDGTPIDVSVSFVNDYEQSDKGSSRDWNEDSERVDQICLHCKNEFAGRKHRLVCAPCWRAYFDFEGISVSDILEEALIDKKFMGTHEGLKGDPYVNLAGAPLQFDPIGMYIWKVYTSDQNIIMFLNKYNKAEMKSRGERSLIVDVAINIHDRFKVE